MINFTAITYLSPLIKYENKSGACHMPFLFLEEMQTNLNIKENAMKELKDATVAFRVSEQEKELLIEQASRLDMPLSQLLRKLVREYLEVSRA